MFYRTTESRWVIILVLLLSVAATLFYARFQLIYSLYSAYQLIQIVVPISL